MTTLENENQEETDHYSRYSLRKWEEKVFGTSYEEPKTFFSIAQVKDKQHCQMYKPKQMESNQQLLLRLPG